MGNINKENTNSKLLYNGVRLPVIGYGTYPLKEELLSSMRFAWGCGYRLFDTSDDYHNQSFIGEVLQSDKKYEGAIISTKISWPVDPKRIRQMFYHYKRLLHLQDRPIDILLMHFPYPYLYVDIWKEMEKLYLDGECRAIGVCNFEEKHLEKLAKHCTIIPMINQIEIHPLFQQKSICEYCRQKNITIMAYSPLARMNNNLFNNDLLNSLAKQYNKKVSQIILRWDIQNDFIPLPSSSNKNHIISNFDIFDFSLTDSEMNIINNLDCGLRIRYNPNTMFNYKWRIKCALTHFGFGKRLKNFKAIENKYIYEES